MSKTRLKVLTISITTVAMLMLFALIIGITFQFSKLTKLKNQNLALQKQIEITKEQSSLFENQTSFFNNTQALEDYYRQMGYGKNGEVYFK